MFTGKLKTSLCVCLLEQGDFVAAERFQSITLKCGGVLGDCGPNCLNSFGLIHHLWTGVLYIHNKMSSGVSIIDWLYP